jgi:hypothetical protein
VKKCLWIAILSLVLTITWGGEGFSQAKKEITFSGTNYWSSTPKVYRIDQDRLIMHSELYGVRVNDSNDGPFHGASVFISGVSYRGKGYFGFRGYETWTDKDGDMLIWELLDTPAGSSNSPARLLGGTGKYVGWEGTMEYTLQFPKPFPEGTSRGICREHMKLKIPQ